MPRRPSAQACEKPPRGQARWRDLFGKVARGDAACLLCGPGRVRRWARAQALCQVLERVQPLEKDGARARDHNTTEATKHTVAPAPLSARATIIKRDAQALERVHTSPQIEKKNKKRVRDPGATPKWFEYIAFVPPNFDGTGFINR